MSYTHNRYIVKGLTQTKTMVDSKLANSNFLRVTTTSANNTITVKDNDYNTLGSILLYAVGDTIHLQKSPNDNVSSSGEVVVSATNLGTAYNNQIINSQDFSGSGWTLTNITATHNDAVAPDGTTTACKIEGTAGSSQKSVANGSLADTGGALTWSLYVKGTGVLSFITNTFWGDRSPDHCILKVNVATGAIKDEFDNWHGAQTHDCGNGWWRVEMSSTVGYGASGAIYVYVADDMDALRGAVSTDTTAKWIWGAQFEDTQGESGVNGTSANMDESGDNAGPFIRTSGAALTEYFSFDEITTTGLS